MEKSNNIYNPFGASIHNVRVYHYRSATVSERFLSVPRDIVESLEYALAGAVGVKPDNHTCYTFEQDEYRAPEGRGKVCVSFSDSTASFGWAIKQGRW